MNHEVGEVKAPTVDDWLNSVSYDVDPNYVPSVFALEFVSFIKLVEGGSPENKTPVVHYHMIDNFFTDGGEDVVNMCHRGIAKSTLKEYLILFIGTFGKLPVFGKVPYALYVSDSMDNGVKKMRLSLEYRWNNSPFLQEQIPKIKITDNRWEFVNKENNSFVVSGHGAKTGVRGTRENNSRPVLALLDDLVSDEDAKSPTVIAKIEDTVSKAIDYALHPTRRKVIWSGTPFNAKDPLYKAVESGAYVVNVYPVCEKFPCTEEEFRGSWPERFGYKAVKRMYDKAKKTHQLDGFYQEMMLRIMSEEDRLIEDSDIRWYDRDSLLRNRGYYNFYITTDFATSEKKSADFNFISVWAINSIGEMFWVDGICKRQQMDKTMADLFRLNQMYSPISVGVEVTGQQGGFVSWIRKEMMDKNCYFTLASSENNNAPGIRPTRDKFSRFAMVVPWFKEGKFYFPENMREHPAIVEMTEELRLITKHGIKSKHDDGIDTVAMLPLLRMWRPSGNPVENNMQEHDGIWAEDDEPEEIDGYAGYTV